MVICIFRFELLLVFVCFTHPRKRFQTMHEKVYRRHNHGGADDTRGQNCHCFGTEQSEYRKDDCTASHRHQDLTLLQNKNSILYPIAFIYTPHYAHPKHMMRKGGDANHHCHARN